ncbi:alpha-D-ribose 1-methylphosphonate 5-triphosphate synthase subunit PhnG [Thermosporothrix hazakensis]|jgi:alpha-D-ribose 1-methylphosphonate 5-triphosphate synthase subunit PhnG|uniref:Alpha-D-ribose 1-methylphosphonate 5-triphosphate synthase subunit PhnG n=1 Tax=Thermosporothrix hazakensis TaxID=644383 RepID=A0A326U9P4_THEHA|nr:phosphonate C-P lyase system protein PhnG [Thermosporothrix hazakensis]PZW32936.1 alpha-D-ribose 1-methylphosphonate 5-triphosphate synthase subunit PhnG [Thermosporothrix hazakensis]GCE48968.1 phosphonate C-P lyase system protein PhnG [Thermosporothrix hazakensis]
MNYYAILANSPEEKVNQLAEHVLKTYPQSHIKLLSGPRQGLVMLRVRETVANSRFNAGELLVTEVRLELDKQFGFGMVLGESARKAMGIALIDAAIRKGGALAEQLKQQITELDQQLHHERRRLQALVAKTKVNFERM